LPKFQALQKLRDAELLAIYQAAALDLKKLNERLIQLRSENKAAKMN